MSRLNILLVIEDNTFFVPDFLEKLVNVDPKVYSIKKVFLVKKIQKKQNINFYLIKNLFNLKLTELLKLFFKFLINKYLKIFKEKSLECILNKKNIDFMNIYLKLSNYLSEIKKCDPDLIINSSSLYFNEEVLTLPKLGCINRHSSILPAGGGFFPIFYGLIYDEPIGTSIHFMSKNIDKGEVIIQREIDKNKYNSIYKFYEKSFIDSAELIHKSLEIIYKKKNYIKYDNVKPSYRSFPTNDDWKIFRKKKYKWI